MIEFTEGRIPEKRLSTLTAYIDEMQLLMHGKSFVKTVIQRLVEQSVIIHRIELENIVNEIVLSPETRKYIEDKIRETIDKAIQQEVNDIFLRDEKK